MKPGLLEIREDLSGDLFCFFGRAASEDYEKFISPHSHNSIGLSYVVFHYLNQVSQNFITRIVAMSVVYLLEIIYVYVNKRVSFIQLNFRENSPVVCTGQWIDQAFRVDNGEFCQ